MGLNQRTLVSSLRFQLGKVAAAAGFGVLILMVVFHLLDQKHSRTLQREKAEQSLEQVLSALSSQLLIYKIHRLPLGDAIRQIEGSLGSGTRLAIRSFDGACLHGVCDRWDEVLPDRIVRPLLIGSERLGEVSLQVDAPPFLREKILPVGAALLLNWVLLLGLLHLFVVRYTHREILSPLARLLSSLEERAEVPADSANTREFSGVFGQWNAALRRIRELTEKEKDLATRAASAEMALQVAHDIRSPLAALDASLSGMRGLPEDRREMIRVAIGRIRDIANNLLSKNRKVPETSDVRKDHSAAEEVHPEVVLLSGLLDSLLSEKRMQFRDYPGLVIDFETHRENYGLFAELDAPEFKRVMSNLINNAVESLNGKAGHVSVILSTPRERMVSILIRDTGSGIPEDVLPRLGERGFTFGKSGGSGLGVFHAKATVEARGGSFAVSSTLGRGTEVTLLLPRAVEPRWFVPELRLAAGTQLVVFDDDSSIHGIWTGRMESLRARERGVVIHHFHEPRSLTQWAISDAAEGDVIYLMDYEILGHARSGLDVIEDLAIADRSILVTSRHEEKHIRERCERLGVRIIPKGLAGFVPIRVMENRS